MSQKVTALHYTEEQQIVLKFAKEFKNGISREDADVLVELANHVGLNNHVPMKHENRSGYWSDKLHIKIANKHIKVFEE